MPPGEDWSAISSRLGAHHKHFDGAMLSKDHDKATEHLYEVQAALGRLVDWMLAYQRINK